MITFKEIYDEIVTYIPNIGMNDAMNLINAAITELNSKSFVQEQELSYSVEDTNDDSNYLHSDYFDLQKGFSQIVYRDIQVLKVLNVLNDDGVVMDRMGIGQEYIDHYDTDNDLTYSQIGDLIFVKENTSGNSVTYTAICKTTLPKFTWNSGDPIFSSGSVKDSFKPAIRYFVLSYIYMIPKYNRLNMAKASFYDNRANTAVINLYNNEMRYKERV